MLDTMGAWVIAFIIYCIFPCQSYKLEGEGVTAKSITVDNENQNGSALSLTEKRSISLKPFRPSKQLFDIVYGHPNYLKTGRAILSRAFDDSAQEGSSKTDYKSPETTFNNLLILPPETITYKFDENQDFSDNTNKVKKTNEVSDIVTFRPPGEGHEDNTYGDFSTQESFSKSKVKEIHYHKHRHLHDYDTKPVPKLISHVHVHNQKQKDDTQSRGENQKVRAPVHKETDIFRDSHNHKHKRNKDSIHHHSSKSHKRQDDHGNSQRHENNSSHNHYNQHGHDGHLSKHSYHSDHADRFVDYNRFHPGESYRKYNEDQYFSDHNHNHSEENKETHKHHYKQRRHKHSKNSKQHHRSRRY